MAGLISSRYAARRDFHSFPTRRSSDLKLHVRSILLNFAQSTPQLAIRTGDEDLPRWHRGDIDKLRVVRSEEHTSELQSRGHLVCRLLLEKKQHRTPDRTKHKPKRRRPH